MTDISKKLGYGGSSEVAGKQLLVTSGAYSSATATSFLQMLDTPPSTAQRNRVIHADGVNSYTGSLSFDVTKKAMDLFTSATLFGRFYVFDVGLHDGNSGYVMTDCKLTSLSVTGSAGGQISASLSFMGKTGFAAGTVANAFVRDDTVPEGYVLGYWWSGAKSGLKAKSWTLNMSQEVVPVYGNLDSKEPLYLKVGLTEYSLDVESYTSLGSDSDKVYIETETFTLVGTTSETGFQFNGVTELGTYKYAFSTGSNTGASDGTVLTIT